MNAKKKAKDEGKPKSEQGTVADKPKRGGGPKAKAKAKGKAKASPKKSSRKAAAWKEESETDVKPSKEEVDSKTVAPSAAKRTPSTKRKLPEAEPETEEPESEEAEDDPSVEEEEQIEFMKKPAARNPKRAKKETNMPAEEVAKAPAKGRAPKSKPAGKARAKGAPKASPKAAPKEKAKSQPGRKRRQSREVEDQDLETDSNGLVDDRMKGIFLQVLKEVAKMPFDDMKDHLISKKVQMENKVCRLNVYWTKCAAAVSLLTEESPFDVVGFSCRTGSFNTRMCAAYMCAWLGVTWMMFICSMTTTIRASTLITQLTDWE